jgi:hypothetical protein
MKIYQVYQVSKLGAIAGLLCIISLSCGGSFSRDYSEKNSNYYNITEANIVYDQLVFPEASDYLIIPVGFQAERQTKATIFLPNTEFGEYRIGIKSSRQSSSMALYNMIFHHQKNGTSHLLLPQNAVIASFNWIEFKQVVNQKTVNQKLIFLEVIPQIPQTKTESDPNTNHPRIAYIADTSGKNLTQLTPDQTKVVSWHLDKELGFMLLKVLQDSDKDGEFTPKDDTSFIRVNLNDPKIGSDIITEPMRKQINQKL